MSVLSVKMVTLTVKHLYSLKKVNIHFYCVSSSSTCILSLSWLYYSVYRDDLNSGKFQLQFLVKFDVNL